MITAVTVCPALWEAASNPETGAPIRFSLLTLLIRVLETPTVILMWGDADDMWTPALRRWPERDRLKGQALLKKLKKYRRVRDSSQKNLSPGGVIVGTDEACSRADTGCQCGGAPTMTVVDSFMLHQSLGRYGRHIRSLEELRRLWSALPRWTPTVHIYDRNVGRHGFIGEDGSLNGYGRTVKWFVEQWQQLDLVDSPLELMIHTAIAPDTPQQRLFYQAQLTNLVKDSSVRVQLEYDLKWHTSHDRFLWIPQGCWMLGRGLDLLWPNGSLRHDVFIVWWGLNLPEPYPLMAR